MGRLIFPSHSKFQAKSIVFYISLFEEGNSHTMLGTIGGWTALPHAKLLRNKLNPRRVFRKHSHYVCSMPIKDESGLGNRHMTRQCGICGHTCHEPVSLLYAPGTSFTVGLRCKSCAARVHIKIKRQEDSKIISCCPLCNTPLGLGGTSVFQKRSFSLNRWCARCQIPVRFHSSIGFSLSCGVLD
jgi:hypothetical protein